MHLTPTIAELTNALESGAHPKLARSSRDEKSAWIETFVRESGYAGLNRDERGIARAYIQAVTGYSRAQMTRYIGATVPKAAVIRAIRTEGPRIGQFYGLVGLTSLMLLGIVVSVPRISSPRASLSFLNTEQTVQATPGSAEDYSSRSVTVTTHESGSDAGFPLFAMEEIASVESRLSARDVIAAANLTDLRLRVEARRAVRLDGWLSPIGGRGESLAFPSEAPGSQFFGAVGTGLNGQVLTMKNGKVVWAFPNFTGTGRAPTPENNDNDSDVTNDDRPTRRGGGGGGGNDDNDSSGTTTNTTIIQTIDSDEWTEATGITYLTDLTQNVGIGTATPGAKLEVVGSISGTSLKLAGLANCNTIDTDAAGNLICGTDEGGVAGSTEIGTASFSGAVMRLADARYVNVGGDTMTGALAIDLSGTNAGVGLEVVETISGSIIFANRGLSTSGSLVWEESASGASLYVATSINGAGLVDCDISSQALKWDATTGRFSCGTVSTGSWSGTGALQTAFDARYVNRSGDTMTGALTINLTSGVIGLEVIQTISGSTIFAGNSLSTSGSLAVERGMAVDGNTLYVDAATDWVGIGTLNPKEKLEVVGTVSGSRLIASSGILTNGELLVDGKTYLNAAAPLQLTHAGFFGCTALETDADGDIVCGSDADTDTNTTYAAGQGLALNGTVFSLNATITGSLLRFQTVSGSTLFARNALASSGTLAVDGGASLNAGVALTAFTNCTALETDSNGTLVCGSDGGGSSYTAGQGLTLNGTSFSVNGTLTGSLASFRTVSGALIQAKNTLASSGSLAWEGAASGASLYVASGFRGSGLADCDLSTSVLRWDETTGRFSCGTVSGGSAWSGTGALQTTFDNRYVNRSGDTMTGALTINLASGVIGLEVIQTISGSTIFANRGLSTSGSLVWEGAGSGSSLYVASSINGAGLTDCDAASSALLWDATTGRFSCGTDDSSGSGLGQNEGDLRYVNQSGDTMTGALTIDLASVTSGVGLEVIETISGAHLYASNSLTTSGTLLVEGSSEFNGLMLAQGGIYSSFFNTSGDLYGGTISGSTMYLAGAFRGAGLTECMDDESTLLWDAESGYFYCGTDDEGTTFTAGQGLALNGSVLVLNSTITGSLLEFQTVSGSTVYASDRISTSGSLLVHGGSTFNGQLNAQEILANALTLTGTLHGTSFSGSSLDITTSIRGAGLADCDADNQTLNWDAATGRFTCGDDDTGGSSLTAGQGLALNGSVLVLNGTISGSLLEFQTVSGSIVHANSLLRSSGSLVTESGAYIDGNTFVVQAGSNRVGIGTSAPGSELDIHGASPELRLWTSGTNSGARLVRETDNSLALYNVVNVSSGGASYAVTLDGAGDYVQVAGTTQYFQSASAFTFAAWVNLDDYDGSYPIIANIRSNGSAPFMIGLSNTATYLGVWFGQSSVIARKTDTAANSLLNTWTHVVVTYDGGGASTAGSYTVYLNGVETATTAASGGVGAYSNAATRLGMAQDGSFPWDGKLDDTRIYNSELSQAEVDSLYGAGNGTMSSVGSNVVGWWKFDEGSGTNANDESSNNNDGTLSGDAAWVTGKVTAASGTQEVAVFNHINGVAPGEEGILQIGDATGGTWMQGQTLRFYSGGSERIRLSSGGLLGIGTTTPGSRLSVSGSTIIGANVGSSSADAGVALEIIGTASGRTVFANNALRSSGSLVWEGAGSGSSLYVARSIRAGGSLASSGTLVWEGAGSGSSLFLNTLGIGIGAVDSGLKLEIAGTASGRVLYAQQALRSSGSLVVEGDVRLGDATSDTVTILGNVGSALTPSANNTYALGSSTNRWSTSWFTGLNVSSDVSVLGVSSLTGNVGIGPANTTNKAVLSVSGTMSGTTVYATRSFSGAGLTDCDAAGSSKLMWDATTGRFSCGTDQTGGSGLVDHYVRASGDAMTGALVINLASGTVGLEVIQTISGSTVFANTALRSSGSLVVEGNSVLHGDLTFGNGSNAVISIQAETGLNVGRSLVLTGGTPGGGVGIAGGGNVYAYGAQGADNVDGMVVLAHDGTSVQGQVAIGKASASAMLDVAGTISGSVVYVTDHLSGPNSTIDVAGHILPTIDGFFTLGTDTNEWFQLYSTWGTFSSGLGVGTEMSSSQAKLEVAGTASGRVLFANDALRSSGSLVIEGLSTLHGNVGIGMTSAGDAALEVLGTVSGSALTINGGMFVRGGNGDVNNDGFATALDLLMIINYLNGGGSSSILTPEEYQRADVNGDGRVNVSDYYMMNTYGILDATENAAAKFITDTAWQVDGSGKIGIGTSSPDTELSVIGTISGSLVTQNGAGNNSFRGNVGIGTTTPGSALSILQTGATALSGIMVTVNNDALSGGTSIMSLTTDEVGNSNKYFQVFTANVAGVDDIEFSFTTDGTARADGTFTGGGADLAEYFKTTQHNLPKGTLIAIAGNGVKAAEGTSPLIGVVSTQPGLVANGGDASEDRGTDPNYVLVGLVGQIPTRVTTANGPIGVGDGITVSSVPGVGRKANVGEQIVGIAMQSYNGSGEGKIEVYVGQQSLAAQNSFTAMAEKLQTVEDLVAASSSGSTVDVTALSANILRSADEKDQDIFRLVNEQLDSIEDRLLTLESQTGSVIGEGAFTDGIVASTLQLTASLSVDGDARIVGDLHLDGALVTNDLFVPGILAVDGSLTASTVTVTNDASVHGTLTLHGPLVMGSGASLQFGSGLTLDSLVVERSLAVLGDVTVDGFARFLGDVAVLGELTVARQAGHLKVPLGATGATFAFDPPFTGLPVVTASPNKPVLYAVSVATSTGFTVSLAAPAEADITFSWVALIVPAGAASIEEAPSGMVFPVDERGVPVSSSLQWNACIRGMPLFDASGVPYSCSRYHDANTWEHPDLAFSFVWNDAVTPPYMQLPDGYVSTVTENSESIRAAILEVNGIQASAEEGGGETPETEPVDSLATGTGDVMEGEIQPSVEESVETPAEQPVEVPAEESPVDEEPSPVQEPAVVPEEPQAEPTVEPVAEPVPVVDPAPVVPDDVPETPVIE